jgi:hypothetical protein
MEDYLHSKIICMGRSFAGKIICWEDHLLGKRHLIGIICEGKLVGGNITNSNAVPRIPYHRIRILKAVPRMPYRRINRKTREEIKVR